MKHLSHGFVIKIHHNREKKLNKEEGEMLHYVQHDREKTDCHSYPGISGEESKSIRPRCFIAFSMTRLKTIVILIPIYREKNLLHKERDVSLRST